MSQKIIRKSEMEQTESLDALVNQEDKLTDLSLTQNSTNVLRGDTVKASEMAKRILEQALQEAKEIKQQAKEILEKVELHAKNKEEEGYQKGREEGLFELTQKIIAFDKKNEAQTKQLEKEITNLVYEIGEKILGRELSERAEAILDLIRQAMQSAGGQNVIILVHPEDLDVVKKNSPLLVSSLDASKTLSIRASEKVARHGCQIETEIGTLDAQLETQLSAIKKALGLTEACENSSDEDLL